MNVVLDCCSCGHADRAFDESLQERTLNGIHDANQRVQDSAAVNSGGIQDRSTLYDSRKYITTTKRTLSFN